MKDYSLKKLILTIVASVIAIMSFCTLLFPIVEFNAGSVAGVSLSALSENGFSFMGFNSIYLTKKDMMLFVTGFVSIAVLIISLLNIFFVVLSIFKESDKDFKLRNAVLILSGVIAVVYMLVGIIDKLTITNKLNGIGADFYKTKAFVPFILIALLIVGYILCEKYVGNKEVVIGTKNKYKNMSEEDRLATLLKYKELLKEEIITAHEFESKKREILLLDEEVKEEKQVKTVNKKSADEIKMEQVMKYKKMYDDGIINKEEFAEMKKKIL